LHNHAKGYFRYFLENEIVLKVSTISIAEYCVRGKIDELPLKNIQIIPFNFDQAKRTGEFAEAIFEENKIGNAKLYPRAIIQNDLNFSLKPTSTNQSLISLLLMGGRKILFPHLKIE
jgi:hypothetical protein